MNYESELQQKIQHTHPCRKYNLRFFACFKEFQMQRLFWQYLVPSPPCLNAKYKAACSHWHVKHCKTGGERPELFHLKSQARRWQMSHRKAPCEQWLAAKLIKQHTIKLKAEILKMAKTELLQIHMGTFKTALHIDWYRCRKMLAYITKRSNNLID